VKVIICPSIQRYTLNTYYYYGDNESSIIEVIENGNKLSTDKTEHGAADGQSCSIKCKARVIIVRVFESRIFVEEFCIECCIQKQNISCHHYGEKAGSTEMNVPALLTLFLLYW